MNVSKSGRPIEQEWGEVAGRSAHSTNTNAIDKLAEAVWRRVIGWEGAELPGGHQCAVKAPTTDTADDCPLYREIHDEIVMWAKARTKEEQKP
jgi:hypothetical protein